MELQQCIGIKIITITYITLKPIKTLPIYDYS